jgi:hypothetical protein
LKKPIILFIFFILGSFLNKVDKMSRNLFLAVLVCRNSSNTTECERFLAKLIEKFHEYQFGQNTKHIRKNGKEFSTIVLE